MPPVTADTLNLPRIPEPPAGTGRRQQAMNMERHIFRRGIDAFQ